MVTTRASAADLETTVLAALAAVPDPEIPTCSIVDLGMVEGVRVLDDAVEVDLLPTFMGCPAKDVIGEDATAAVEAVAGTRSVRVRFVLSPPWTSDRITDAGREALRGYGISGPQHLHGAQTAARVVVPLRGLAPQAPSPCPFCGSRETQLESGFGPTPCRTTHYCRACRNPFEGFKPKTAS